MRNRICIAILFAAGTHAQQLDRPAKTSGHPNLNGIWPALNTAYWNLEGHFVERWRIEGGSPSVLLRLGWNRNSLPPGTRIKVVAFQAKDGSLRASSRDIEFPDGRKMDLGGSANTNGPGKEK